MTLFDNNRKEQLKTIAPLAARMRPKNFKEFIGHQNLVGESSSLRKSIQSGKIPSMILWGPPGTGKPTLANAVVNFEDSHAMRISHAIAKEKPAPAAGPGITAIVGVVIS